MANPTLTNDAARVASAINLNEQAKKRTLTDRECEELSRLLKGRVLQDILGVSFVQAARARLQKGGPRG